MGYAVALFYAVLFTSAKSTNDSGLLRNISMLTVLEWTRSEAEILFGGENPEVDFGEILTAQLLRIQSTAIKVVVFKEPPETDFLANGVLELLNGTKIPINKDSLDVLLDLRDALDLTFDIVQIDDWNKMFKMAEDKEIELLPLLITLSDHNKPNGKPFSDAVDALIPLTAHPSVAYFKQPSISSETQYVVFEPLQDRAWIMIVTFWLMCVFACHLTHRLPPSGHTDVDGSSGISISEMVVWVATILRGGGHIADMQSKKSLCFATLSATFFCIIMWAVYTANVVVHLSEEPKTVKTPNDLLKFKYQIQTWDETHLYRIFNLQKLKLDKRRIPILQNTTNFGMMKNLLEQKPGRAHRSLAYLAVLDGFIFKDPRINLYERELCEISSFVSQETTPKAFAVNAGSVYRNILNWKILQIMERGINSRHIRYYAEVYVYTCYSPMASVTALSIQHVFFAFLIFGIGAVSALVFVVCENLMNVENAKKKTSPFNF